MSKKIISLVLCMVLLCAVLPTPAHAEGLPFTDVPKNWAYEGIEYCYNNGLMSGVSGTLFKPDAACTRSMVVTVLYRMAGYPDVTGYNNPFKDVKGGWYYDAVLWAANNGIVKGTSTTTFSPNMDVTREQLATFLYRFADYMGYDVSEGIMLAGLEDYNQIGSYALDAVSWAFGTGILTGVRAGDGRLYMQPIGKASRAQVAVMLLRFHRTYLPVTVQWCGLEMTLPSSWRGNYVIEENMDFISFYCKQEHESSGAGLLFTITYLKPSEMGDIPVKYDVPGGLLLDGVFYNVVVMYPGGVECLDYVDLYLSMRAAIPAIEKSFHGYGGVVYGQG